MGTDQTGPLLRHVRRAVLLRDGTDLTDGQLLGRFVEGRDEVAFAALVRRHGPMVWGVCRRLLDLHDAEDAFQATFLVLVRKAASVRPREMVANWLHGVARQAALQARRTTVRRRARERQSTRTPDPPAAERQPEHDLRFLLDQELGRLPEKYRAAVVLCDLEGRSRKEAARQLGCPEGTVAGRLARARAMLARRLARRGLPAAGGVLAGALWQGTASACVPASVASSTVRAAGRLAAGQATDGVVSAGVLALSEGVRKAMLLTRLKVAAVAVLLVAALCCGAGLLFQSRATAQDRPPEGSKRDAAKGGEKAKLGEHADAVRKELERLQGTWEIASWEIPGGNLPLPDDKELRTLTVEGARATLRVGKQEIVTTWLIDPEKKPKRLDICYEQRLVDGKPEDGGFDGKVGPAIYELDGDTLRECSDDPGERRPDEFSVARPALAKLLGLKESHRSLLTLKRVKPGPER